MEINELDSALDSGVPLIYQGPHDYQRATGSLTGILKRRGNVVSCELTTKSATSGRNSVIYCRPEELRLWNPADSKS